MTVPVINGQLEHVLDHRELVNYRRYKQDLIQWLLHVGKDPDYAEGYAEATVRQVSYKTDSFFSWIWDERGHYTTRATIEDADEYMLTLIYGDHSSGHKSSTQKCIKRLFKWRRSLGEDLDWEPAHSFTSEVSQPRDYLTREERGRIREAALRYGSVPSYNTLTSRERAEWKRYLAQRFEKPMRDVGPDDFKRANSWKIPSLVWVSLDAGLRPIESPVRTFVGWATECCASPARSRRRTAITGT